MYGRYLKMHNAHVIQYFVHKAVEACKNLNPYSSMAFSAAAEQEQINQERRLKYGD